MTKSLNRSKPLELDELLEVLRSLASEHARSTRLGPRTRDELWLALCSWWSEYYNRPLKDPILEKYTLEELAYEFFLKKMSDPETVKKQAQEKKNKEDEEWAIAEARAQFEAYQQKLKAAKAPEGESKAEDDKKRLTQMAAAIPDVKKVF